MCAYNTAEFNPPAPRKSQCDRGVGAGQTCSLYALCAHKTASQRAARQKRTGIHHTSCGRTGSAHTLTGQHTFKYYTKNTVAQHIHVIIVTDHEMDTGGVKRMLRDCPTAKRTQRTKNTMMTRVLWPDIIGYTKRVIVHLHWHLIKYVFMHKLCTAPGCGFALLWLMHSYMIR